MIKTPKQAKIPAENAIDAFGSAADYPLDEVYGIRGWSADRYGRLVSVADGVVWTPGVNEAVCAPTYRSPKKTGPHPLSGCTHGFWAYFRNDRLFHVPEQGDYRGIIRGSGNAAVGTKGFRIANAEIVALTIPGSANRLSFLKPVNWLFPRRYFWTEVDFAGPAIAIFGIISLIVFIPSSFFGPGSAWFLSFLGLTWSLISLLTQNASWRRTKGHYGWNARDKTTTPHKLEPDEFKARIKQLYPGVKVYSNVYYMIWKHKPSKRSNFVEKAGKPLTLNALPTPETDPDFWSKR